MIAIILISTLTGFHTGLWVRAMSMASPDSIPRIVALAEEMGVTDIYAQAVVGGYSYYRSGILPRSEYLAKNSPAGYDPLAELCRAAEEKNINVHAWINVFLIWSLDSAPDSARHVQRRHPEWFIKDVFGRSAAQYTSSEWQNLGIEGTYLDPANTYVRDHVARVCAEVASHYGIRGVHLDFIRFPGIYWDLPDAEPAVLLCGMDAEDIRWMTFIRYPRLDIFRRWLVYNYFLMNRQRSAEIERTMRAITYMVRSAKRDCLVSAAVAANPSRALYQYGQDWRAWGSDLVDYVIVMSYTQDILLFKDLADHAYIYHPEAIMGIGLLWPDMEREARWQRQYVADGSRRGVCYFDFASLDTMIDIGLLNGDITVEEESLCQDTARFAQVDGLFKEPVPDQWVRAGKEHGHEEDGRQFADFLRSLSLAPERDLARMRMTREDFQQEIETDVAAFEYLNSRIFPVGPEYIEPPRREIDYEFLDWDDRQGDSTALVGAAEKMSRYALEATVYPVSMNALARPVFEADTGEPGTFLSRAGIFAYRVRNVHEGGGRIMVTDVRPDLAKVYMYWTIRERFNELLEQQ
jgi:uncharacterized lipoprotein YddW (UPF0748 family)